MRGQQVYCFRSVTSNNQDIRLHLLFAFNHPATSPTFFVEWKQLHVGTVLADATFYLQQQFSLVNVTQFTKERTVLNTLQAVVKTGIGNLRSCTIMSNVIDQQTTHTSPSCNKWFVLFPFTTHEESKMAGLA